MEVRRLEAGIDRAIMRIVYVGEYDYYPINQISDELFIVRCGGTTGFDGELVGKVNSWDDALALVRSHSGRMFQRIECLGFE